MIKKESVDEVLFRNDVESVIGSYVSLKRAGSNLKGLCPFHNEKTPSFTVYPAENSFYCFGCGVGGNVITFIRQMEHLDYPDAVEFLAKRAGITVIKDDDSVYEQHTGIRKDRLYKMNVDAARFFHTMLYSNNEKAKFCLNYFMEKRGLSSATIKHFGLGFAPDSYDAMIKYMKSRGYTEDELVQGFFAQKSAKGNYIDNFRNRAMFPIIDAAGNVIAFGGRVLDDSKPKYRNTMDTVVYKKSRNLFALNFAKQASSESLILCEGYLDVISLHQAGFTNAVASLGTAITADQARLMARYTKKVNVCYDSDEAGQKATQRAMKILNDAGLEVVIISIPGEKDPDDYIKAYGKDKFADIINGAKSKFEYNMDTVLRKYDLNLAQDKINAVSELEKLISSVYSMAERDIYIQTISKRLGVDAKSIKADVDKLVARQVNAYKRNESEKMKQAALGYSDKVNPDFARAPAVAAHEENVLGLLLLYPEHRKKVFEEGLLSDEHFYTGLNSRVFAYLRNEYFSNDNGAVDDINSSFSTDEVGRITKMKLSRMQLDNNGTEVLLESIELLKKSIEIKKATSADNINDLNNLINSIRNKN